MCCSCSGAPSFTGSTFSNTVLGFTVPPNIISLPVAVSGAGGGSRGGDKGCTDKPKPKEKCDYCKGVKI